MDMRVFINANTKEKVGQSRLRSFYQIGSRARTADRMEELSRVPTSQGKQGKSGNWKKV